MAAIELKRYFIKPDCWDEFLDDWRRVLTVRRRHGFQVLFAFRDRESSIFTWAIKHDGDFDQAAEGYYRDPERVELETIGNYISDHEIKKVEELPLS